MENLISKYPNIEKASGSLIKIGNIIGKDGRTTMQLPAFRLTMGSFKNGLRSAGDIFQLWRLIKGIK